MVEITDRDKFDEAVQDYKDNHDGENPVVGEGWKDWDDFFDSGGLLYDPTKFYLSDIDKENNNKISGTIMTFYFKRKTFSDSEAAIQSSKNDIFEYENKTLENLGKAEWSIIILAEIVNGESIYYYDRIYRGESGDVGNQVYDFAEANRWDIFIINHLHHTDFHLSSDDIRYSLHENINIMTTHIMGSQRCYGRDLYSTRYPRDAIDQSARTILEMWRVYDKTKFTNKLTFFEDNYQNDKIIELHYNKIKKIIK